MKIISAIAESSTEGVPCSGCLSRAIKPSVRHSSKSTPNPRSMMITYPLQKPIKSSISRTQLLEACSDLEELLLSRVETLVGLTDLTLVLSSILSPLQQLFSSPFLLFTPRIRACLLFRLVILISLVILCRLVRPSCHLCKPITLSCCPPFGGPQLITALTVIGAPHDVWVRKEERGELC